VPLAGKTLLQWQIEKLKAVGITDIVVNVHHFPDMIINYLKENDYFGCNIQVSDEREMLLETGGGLRYAHKAMQQLGNDRINEGILICNVDILSNIRLKDLLKAYNPNEMGLVVVSERSTQRYLLFNEENRLCGWTNIATGEVKGNEAIKRLGDKTMKKLAFSGMQVLNPRVFTHLDDLAKQKGDKFSLIDLYLHIAEKEILRAYIPENYHMMDVGKIDQLSEAEAFAQNLH
jgi:NDP-sugar pyrophosphorylase family protein